MLRMQSQLAHPYFCCLGQLLGQLSLRLPVPSLQHSHTLCCQICRLTWRSPTIYPGLSLPLASKVNPTLQNVLFPSILGFPTKVNSGRSRITKERWDKGSKWHMWTTCQKLLEDSACLQRGHSFSMVGRGDDGRIINSDFFYFTTPFLLTLVSLIARRKGHKSLDSRGPI